MIPTNWRHDGKINGYFLSSRFIESIYNNYGLKIIKKLGEGTVSTAFEAINVEHNKSYPSRVALLIDINNCEENHEWASNMKILRDMQQNKELDVNYTMEIYKPIISYISPIDDEDYCPISKRRKWIVYVLELIDETLTEKFYRCIDDSIIRKISIITDTFQQLFAIYKDLSRKGYQLGDINPDNIGFRHNKLIIIDITLIKINTTLNNDDLIFNLFDDLFDNIFFVPDDVDWSHVDILISRGQWKDIEFYPTIKNKHEGLTMRNIINKLVAISLNSEYSYGNIKDLYERIITLLNYTNDVNLNMVNNILDSYSINEESYFWI